MGLRDLSLWLSGNDPKVLEGEPRDATHAMRLLGGAIALAGAVAALNWGMAAYAIFGTWAAAVAGGMIGAGAVISSDRTAVFIADSTDPGFFRTAALCPPNF